MLPNIPILDIHNNQINLQDFQGKSLLIVNVASKCGFTSQYKGLQSLYEQYQSKGLEILGFPCNQFGSQEPGSHEDIQAFCETNYKITFPMLAKIDVNGANTHPLYTFLKKECPGILGTESIKWNFTKFFISKDGKVVKRYASNDDPSTIGKEISIQL
jgi:glutathione peroxidase